MIETAKYHREALKICLESKEREAFTDKWSVEKELWIKDIREIILEMRKHLEETDIKIILNDCRYISETAMDDTFQMTYKERQELKQHRNAEYYNNLTK